MTLARNVAPEMLDHLAPDDPDAMRSRRDLVRVHSAMGTRSILKRGFTELVDMTFATQPLRILEMGAGDGTLLLGLARALKPRWPQVQLTLLDRQRIVTPETLKAYAALGWEVSVQVVDVMDWADLSESQGKLVQRWDLVTAALFLHHFESPTLHKLLRAIASQSDRFFACEPSRDKLALWGSHLIGALGVNAVTREDAVLSVHAGFQGRELTSLWPENPQTWQTREFGAGLFSHCFSARRTRKIL